MAVVVCPATVIGDESHGIAGLNELGVLINEFCNNTMRRSLSAVEQEASQTFYSVPKSRNGSGVLVERDGEACQMVTVSGRYR